MPKPTYKRKHFSPAVRRPHELARAEARLKVARGRFEQAMEEYRDKHLAKEENS